MAAAVLPIPVAAVAGALLTDCGLGLLALAAIALLADIPVLAAGGPASTGAAKVRDRAMASTLISVWATGLRDSFIDPSP
jgi:hypothetical protein